MNKSEAKRTPEQWKAVLDDQVERRKFYQTSEAQRGRQLLEKMNELAKAKERITELEAELEGLKIRWAEDNVTGHRNDGGRIAAYELFDKLLAKLTEG